MATWQQDLEHLEMLESEGRIEEYLEFKQEKGILELWEVENENNYISF